MYISFDYYRAFYYVAKYGSISQAAEALMNNQPNVSRTIKNLESELNCTLFVRSRKGVELTPEGEMLYAHVAAADRKSTRLNSSHDRQSRMPSSA